MYPQESEEFWKEAVGNSLPVSLILRVLTEMVLLRPRPYDQSEQEAEPQDQIVGREAGEEKAGEEDQLAGIEGMSHPSVRAGLSDPTIGGHDPEAPPQARQGDHHNHNPGTLEDATLETLDLSSLVLGATSTEQVLDSELSRLPYEELMRLPPGERAEFLGVDSAVRDDLKEELTETERIYGLLCDAAPETHALVVRILEETDAETTALIRRLLDARRQIKEVTAAFLRPT